MQNKWNNFWSGITNELRSTVSSAFWYSENLEVGKGKSVKQVPNNQAENVGTYSVDSYITKLIQVGTNVYGLGQDGATNKDTTIWTKTNQLNANWAIPTNGTIATTTFRGGDSLFVYLNGSFYFDGGNDYIAKYTGTTMSATWKPLTGGMKGGTIWQGNIYGWNGQNVYEIDPVAGTVTDKIAIPFDQTIVDLVASGNLMHIICTSTVTVSRMYIWDGVSTTVFTDIVDIGMGTVSGGAVLEGQTVVAIGNPNKRTLKLKSHNSSTGLFGNLFTYTGRLNRAATYNYILPASKLKSFSGFVYFIVTGTQPDGTYAGLYDYAIARFGREEPLNPLTFSIYKTLDFTSARVIDGATTNNDFTIIESIVGGADTVDRAIHAVINSNTLQTTFFSSSSNTYTAQPGVLETCKFTGLDKNGVGDPSIPKLLLGLSAQYTALPTAGQVICKYKKDEETTWTTIFTDVTDNAISHETINIESSGNNLPTFKEIQFRFELTGGAELTGYKVAWKDLASIL